jgi:hypothetical protein
MEFNRLTNLQASAREYLLGYIEKLPITTSNTIKLQAKCLAQVTRATHQLTRTTVVSSCFSIKSIVVRFEHICPR